MQFLLMRNIINLNIPQQSGAKFILGMESLSLLFTNVINRKSIA